MIDVVNLTVDVIGGSVEIATEVLPHGDDVIGIGNVPIEVGSATVTVS